MNRHYSAAQGRFTQVDPIGMGGVNITNPQYLNLYAYCLNDPINYVDPLGLLIYEGAAVGGSIGGPVGAVIGAIIGAVIGALRVIFGGRGPRTRMGKRLEQRVAQRETGSRISGGWPSIRSGIGAVNSYIGGDDPDGYRINEKGELVLVIRTTEIKPAPAEDASWLRLGWDWISGTGKNHRTFGPGSRMAEGMRTSPEIALQRAQYCKNGPRVGPLETRRFGLYGWGMDSVVSFGLPTNPITIGIRGTASADGALRALGNGPRSFVGSYGLKITSTSNGGAIFEIYNETSLSSFFGGFMGSVKRGDSLLNLPGSTISQTIWWKESNPCGK